MAKKSKSNKFQLTHFKNGIYQGEVVFREKSGFGAFSWDSGEFYYGLWSKNKMNGRGILFLPNEIVIRGVFRNDTIHGKCYIMVGGKIMLICQFCQGKIAGDTLRIEMNEESGEYAAYSIRSGKYLSGFIMKEEYFMNYDFLRKINKIKDVDGFHFKTLDFQDGGMFYGLVNKSLPNGLGLFVYPDLKYHSGIYKDGLLEGLSRVNFGNGDIYEGEVSTGKMSGPGFFINAETEEWVFGEFVEDECKEVFHNGTGYPFEEISNFRQYIHQQSENYIDCETDILDLDLDQILEVVEEPLIPFTNTKILSEAIKEELSTIPKSSKKSNKRKQSPEPFNEIDLNQPDSFSPSPAKRSLDEFYRDAELKKREAKRSKKRSPKLSKTHKNKENEGFYNKIEKKMVYSVKERPEKSRKASPYKINKNSRNKVITNTRVIKPMIVGMQGIETHRVDGPNSRYSNSSSYSEERRSRPPSSGVRLKHSKTPGRNSTKSRNQSVQTETEKASVKTDATSPGYLQGIIKMVDEIKAIVNSKLSNDNESPIDSSNGTRKHMRIVDQLKDAVQQLNNIQIEEGSLEHIQNRIKDSIIEPIRIGDANDRYYAIDEESIRENLKDTARMLRCSKPSKRSGRETPLTGEISNGSMNSLQISPDVLSTAKDSPQAYRNQNDLIEFRISSEGTQFKSSKKQGTMNNSEDFKHCESQMIKNIESKEYELGFVNIYTNSDKKAAFSFEHNPNRFGIPEKDAEISENLEYFTANTVQTNDLHNRGSNSKGYPSTIKEETSSVLSKRRESTKSSTVDFTSREFIESQLKNQNNERFIKIVSEYEKKTLTIHSSKKERPPLPVQNYRVTEGDLRKISKPATGNNSNESIEKALNSDSLANKFGSTNLDSLVSDAFNSKEVIPNVRPVFELNPYLYHVGEEKFIDVQY